MVHFWFKAFCLLKSVFHQFDDVYGHDFFLSLPCLGFSEFLESIHLCLTKFGKILVIFSNAFLAILLLILGFQYICVRSFDIEALLIFF